MYLSTLVWTLRPDKTYDDFVRAWYPDECSEIPSTLYLGVNINDKSEVVSIGLHETDMARDELAQSLLQTSARETERSRRIGEVVESSRPGSFFRVRDTFDLFTPESFDANRP